MDLKNIRNFCIIAHIDHGKSTIADRLLELTGTIPERKMREQVLDSMELERERGITIKMTPVRMEYRPQGTMSSSSMYILNLIDTPGHIDFSYEVSRALRAVEGAILLVDATQGVQAQTLSVLAAAREAGLKIIPAVNKIDSSLARTIEVKKEIAKLLNGPESGILEVSGKTGQGVPELLAAIVEKIPSPSAFVPHSLPRESLAILRGSAPRPIPSARGGLVPGSVLYQGAFRALVFDFKYSTHTGVIVYVRVFEGSLRKSEKSLFKAARKEFSPIEVGIFSPEEVAVEILGTGEIGYIVTGIKEPGVASVGDTITLTENPLPSLAGYMSPKPVVWASVYPESQDDFTSLRQAMERLRLSDSSFTREEESSGLLGRGFRCGFLGMLHLEIITERLRREFGLKLVVTHPSISYEVVDKRGNGKIFYSPTLFPEYGEIAKIFEPWAEVKIITPEDYLGAVTQLLWKHEAVTGETETFGDKRVSVSLEMPLRELMRGFFDELKSVSSGFASLSYKIGGFREADVVKLEILVAEETVPAFSRVVSRKRVEEEAEAAVEKLCAILPRQLFATKIQARALGRIISSQTLSALRKDVTGYLYGGDVTRKMKLLEKQKKGKKKLKALGRGNVNIPQEVFLKMMRTD